MLLLDLTYLGFSLRHCKCKPNLSVFNSELLIPNIVSDIWDLKSVLVILEVISQNKIIYEIFINAVSYAICWLKEKIKLLCYFILHSFPSPFYSVIRSLWLCSLLSVFRYRLKMIMLRLFWRCWFSFWHFYMKNYSLVNFRVLPVFPCMFILTLERGCYNKHKFTIIWHAHWTIFKWNEELTFITAYTNYLLQFQSTH